MAIFNSVEKIAETMEQNKLNHHQLVYSVFDCGSNSAYRRSGVRNGLLQRLVHRSREGERSHLYGRGGDWQFETSPCCHSRRTQFHACKTQPLLTLAAGSTRHATACNKDDGRRSDCIATRVHGDGLDVSSTLDHDSTKEYVVVLLQHGARLVRDGRLGNLVRYSTDHIGHMTYVTSWFGNESTFTNIFREIIVFYATIATVCNMFAYRTWRDWYKVTENGEVIGLTRFNKI